MGRLNGCCCCFNLRDGSLAVGITFLVLGSLGFVVDIGLTIWEAQQEFFHSTTEWAAVTAFTLSLDVLCLAMNALLVQGVKKSHRGMILSWIIYAGIVLGLLSAAVVLGFIVFCILGITWLMFFMLMALAALTGVFWYWFTVVLHYYQDLRERNGFVYSNYSMQTKDGQA